MSTNTNSKEGDPVLFWGCFIALITTAFAFITRAFLVNDPGFWPKDFGFDTVQGQELFGAGIWPFAISIIIFSAIIVHKKQMQCSTVIVYFLMDVSDRCSIQ